MTAAAAAAPGEGMVAAPPLPAPPMALPAADVVAAPVPAAAAGGARWSATAFAACL
jgi:hypothetical protein